MSPTPKFKNTQDLFHPHIHSFVVIHGNACRELVKEYPSYSREQELLDVILDCEEKFPILREFRQSAPEIDRPIQSLIDGRTQAN